MTIDKEAYIRSGGVNCPYCGSDDLEDDNLSFDSYALPEGKHYFQDVYCHGCSRSWTNEFTLTDIILDEAQEPDEED